MDKLIFVILVIFIFSSCKDEPLCPNDQISCCRICGVANRLPEDIVSMENLYLSAAFLDVDNDGDLDMAFGSWGDPSKTESSYPLTDRLLLNDGNGYFTDAGQSAMPPKLSNGVFSGATDIAPIDVNNDGHIDMLLAHWTGDLIGKKVQLLLNNGNGQFTDATDIISDNDDGHSHTEWVRTGDFDGDGLIDFMTSTASWRNTGSGFERRVEGAGASDLVDLDGDSLPDLILLHVINDDFFQDGLPELMDGLNSTVALDADSDGDMDLFVVQGLGFGDTVLPVKILINDGSGKFSYAADEIFIPAPPKFYFGDPGAADFNGDGLTDIFIQEGGTDAEPYPGGQNRIFIQKADGTFVDETEQRLPTYNDYSHHHALGDIDGDGDIDIYNNSGTGGDYVSSSLLINDGNGFFTEEW